MAATTGTIGAPRRGVLSRIAGAVTSGPASIFLIIVGLMWLVPTLGLFFASMRSAADNTATGWWKIFTEPAQLTLESYRNVLDNPTMVDGLLNTTLITVPATLLTVLIAALAGYAFAWVTFRGRDALFLLVIGLLVVPLQVALIPVSRLYGSLSVSGIPGVVIFHVAFGLPFAIFLLRNFFVGIPKELLEAARMDGAGELTIFYRVVLPLGIPAIASLAIFQFLWVWNDLLVALVFAGDSSPLTVVIREQTRSFGANIDVIAPGAFLSLIVPLIVFFAFQRYFVQGIMAGATK